MGVLGQVNAAPILPVDIGSTPTWAQSKAFWFERLGYAIHADEVRDFHASEARIRIPTAPARTSKSFSAAYDLVPFCLPTEPLCDSLIWLIGPNFNVNKEFEYARQIFVDNRHHFAAPGGACYEIERNVHNTRAGDMEIRFVKGRDKQGRQYRTIIRGMSAENEKALQGEEVTLAVQSEAAEHPAHIMSKYLETRCSWIVCPTTPKAQAAWLQELCEEGAKHPEIGVQSFNFPPHANPTYKYERYEAARVAAEKRARAQLGKHATAEDDPYFAEQFLGRWVYYQGRVLPISDDRNVIARGSLEPYWNSSRFMVSVDYGYDDFSCALFWSVLPNGILVIFDEIYERKLTSEKFIGKVLDLLGRHEIVPDYVCADPSRPEVDRLMRDAGLDVFVMDKNAQRDRAAGTRRIVDLLVSGPVEGFPGLFVTDNCVNVRKEWRELHYKEGYTNEYSPSSIRGNDHSFDAARYYVMTRPEPAPLPTPTDEIGRFIKERQAEVQNARRLKRHRMGWLRHAAA